jgi:Flp pilus assembly protein TadD
VRFPGVSGVGLDLAFCREKLGDAGGAESAARAVLERDGDNPAALNFLGYLFADHNRNLAEAESMIHRAVDMEPDNGAYLDSMGWVYYRLGRLAEARVPLERAAQITPDPVVLEHLGDVYKALNLLELAKVQYQRCLSQDSLNPRVRAKLDGIR